MASEGASGPRCSSQRLLRERAVDLRRPSSGAPAVHHRTGCAVSQALRARTSPEWDIRGVDRSGCNQPPRLPGVDRSGLTQPPQLPGVDRSGCNLPARLPRVSRSGCNLPASPPRSRPAWLRGAASTPRSAPCLVASRPLDSRESAPPGFKQTRRLPGVVADGFDRAGSPRPIATGRHTRSASPMPQPIGPRAVSADRRAECELSTSQHWVVPATIFALASRNRLLACPRSHAFARTTLR